MVDKILNGIGIPYRETLFRQAPKGTYAVYHKSFDSRGADDVNLIRDIDISIEVYSHTPVPDIEAKIESRFDSLGIAFDKQQRYWIDSEQLYQVIYDFNYQTKEGGQVNV